MEIPLWLPVVFFVIALFYSMVGFGGGSSYLAVLVLAGFSYQAIPPQALICNVIVAGGGFWHFLRGGHFRLKKVLPFVVASIPMAYLGGRIPINEKAFCLLLGFSLLAVAVRLWMVGPSFLTSRDISWKKAWVLGIPIGAALGFLAGLIGIGGGIFLGPLLLLMKWADPKEAAASAAFFIAVNSLSGLAGQLQKGVVDFGALLPLAIAVLIGGQIGARLGSYHLPKGVLQKGLIILVLYVSIRLIVKGL